jgi:FSR family fosmidomycin resistance protein-like MFS transporter
MLLISGLVCRLQRIWMILVAVSLVGVGSSIFTQRLLGSGGKGLAQSIFQLGGNTGSAIGPLLVAVIVAPYGQFYIIWFVIAGFLGIWVLPRSLYGTKIIYHYELQKKS